MGSFGFVLCFGVACSVVCGPVCGFGLLMPVFWFGGEACFFFFLFRVRFW